MVVVSDAKVVAELRALGFSDEVVSVPRRLVVSVAGREKTGKTHFALTAPGPIVFFNVDIGTEGVVHKFQEAGKQVLVYDVRVPKGATKEVYQTMWAETKNRIAKAYSLSQGTVVWDTATEVYELARLSHFGRLTQVLPHNYVEVNSEWREILRSAYDASISSVFVHKMKPRWVSNQRTSEYELSGFAEMDYLAQVNLVSYREPVDEGEGAEFSILVKDCRHAPQYSGRVLRGPLCDFGVLLAMVHGKGQKA